MKKFIVILAIALALSSCGVASYNTGGAEPRAGALPESPRPEAAAIPPLQEAPEQPLAYTLTLTIPEGFTLLQIGMALEELGVHTAEQFVHAAQTGDFGEFPLFAAQAPNPNRFLALEGYLFPGIYEIYLDEPPEDVIRRMLSVTEQMIDEDLRDAITRSGYTVDEIIIIASIIQKESLGNDEAKPLVSSVIHNRLNTGMMLQMCYTSFYVRDFIAPFFEGEDHPFGEFYNTYICPALPAGAISNPGLNAIRAALFPADTRYFFYIWDNDGGFHFAAEWEEHVANVQRYLR